MFSTCELTFNEKENNFMYLKALYTVGCLFILDNGNKMMNFTQATLILLMHEFSVKIWPLALRKNVLDERCL